MEVIMSGRSIEQQIQERHKKELLGIWEQFCIHCEDFTDHKKVNGKNQCLKCRKESE